MKLLVASGNAKKLAELRALLAPPRVRGVEVVSPADVGGIPDVEEDRPTFAGNAAKKARSGARASGHWTLADDSGLCVETLDGAPGVRSARFAGEPSDDARNNAKLLRALAGRPAAERGAEFVCALALASPDGEIVMELRGTAHGTILEAPRGTSGFGYDPLFLFDEEGEPGCGRAFAELTREEKSNVSHRGRALAQLADRLTELVPSS